MRNKPLFAFLIAGLIAALGVLAAAPLARAISEKNYESTYTNTVLPFRNSGEKFTFPSADGKYRLSGVRFIHPHEKGLIVVVNGFTESWMKYGELFYDLYKEGYSVISYDHRGQGLSPHLVPRHPQIGYVDHFSEYADDLNAFMEKVAEPLHPESKNLFLIANSMGGAVAAEYLERHPSTFEAAVLSAPMLAINTKPYPPCIAHGMVAGLGLLGLGRHYAIGQHDANLDAPFENNTLTGSKVRWWSYGYVGKENPEILIGGASNHWVDTSLSETRHIRQDIPLNTTRVLLLEAGKDQFVLNKPISAATTQMPHTQLLSFPDSKHGILMESDPIRNKAMKEIEKFFQGKE
jgi:lysophospholipase